MLRPAARLATTAATLQDLAFDDEVRLRLETLCEEAAASKGETAEASPPWLALWGPAGIGKREIASRWAAHAGRPLLALDPQALGKADGDELLRRAQREALLHGAVLYIGPLGGETLGTELKELTRQLLTYPDMVILGVETVQPPQLKLDRALREVQLELPDEVTRVKLWERYVPEPTRALGLDLDVVARLYRLTPGEIAGIAAEAVAIARQRRGGLVCGDDLRLPEQVPCANDIDFAELAEAYGLTGGHIRNAAVRAAFLAASADEPVHGELLHHAAVMELEDMGRLVARASRLAVAPGPPWQGGLEEAA